MQRRIFFLTICILFMTLLLSACAKDSPYDQYVAAYQYIWEADSFITEIVESDFESRTLPDNTVEAYSFSGEIATQLVHTSDGYLSISDLLIYDDSGEILDLTTYYNGGWIYNHYNDAPENNFRQLQNDDFAIKMAIEGVIDFPENTIAKQTAEETDEGTILTFELDSEKYYEYIYPPISDDYQYGVFSSYREPPLYTVLLDEQEHIKQVTGHFCTVNSDDRAFTRDHNYTVSFIQYGGVELDLPELNDADYPIYPDSQLGENIGGF